MNHRRSKTLLIASLALFLSCLVSACGDPFAPIKVKNETNQTLVVFVNERNIGSVAPGGELKDPPVPIYAVFVITAKNAQGDVVYTKTLSFQEIEKIGWKIVITAPSTNPS